jgi:hypothetical protein
MIFNKTSPDGTCTSGAMNPANKVRGRAGEESEGTLDRFIRAFNLYESDANLFKRCRDKDGFAWWDIVRYRIQFALCAEKGIYSYPKGGKKRLLARAASFARQSLLLLKDALRIAFLRANRIERIYVFRRRSKFLLEEIGNSNCQSLVVGETGVSYSPHVAISKQSLDFFVRVVSKFVRVPRDVMVEAERLEEEIKARFSSEIDTRSIILSKYKQHQASRMAWSAILSGQEAVKYVGFIGDDSLKALVCLANAREIRTREFQHAYMGKSHVNYSYPDLTTPVATLPLEVMVHRDTGDIIYPATIIRPAGAGVAPGDCLSEASRDIDVLIGGSPSRAEEVISIAGALVDKGLTLAVKLHPAQTEFDSGLRKHFRKEQVQIYSNEHDFCALARRARVYVAGNPTSTTVFEAVENGAKLIVVENDGMKLTRMLDKILSRRVISFGELHNAVRLELAQKEK